MAPAEGVDGGAEVRLHELTKTFGPVVAVQDVSVTIEPGSFFTLLGPSGSGKTTTLMMVAGFAHPTRGEVFVDGKPVAGLPPQKRDLGMVFQSYAVFPHLTVFDNIAFPLQVRRAPRAEIRHRVGEALELVRLQGYDRRLPRQLSGGELGRTGVVNQSLTWLGLTDAPLPLLYNTGGVVIGMTYVLLPYMVLTAYSVMRGIEPGLIRAAHSLGASRWQAFRRVFWPLSLPGIAAGTLLVFILSLGFFITPALMGGPADVMIAMLIEREVEFTLNWSFASALAVILLVLTLIGFVGYNRIVRLERLFEARG